MGGDRPRDLAVPLQEVRVRIHGDLAGLRLDQALQRLLPWRSRSSVQRLIKERRVAVLPREAGGGSRAAGPVRPSFRVARDDVVVVRVPPRLLPEEPRDLPDGVEIPVLFEDRWVVALDKPAGLAVHPAGRRLTRTLINRLHELYRDAADPARDVVPRLCHRLDRETSGLILVAKDARTHAELRRQFEALAVHKSYLAVVEGVVRDDGGSIDLPLGPATRSQIRLKIAPRPDGLAARTRFEVRRRGRNMTLVECFPETGRQHQLRVHLAAIGHPVVGDKLYGPDETWFLDAIAGRLTAEARARLRLPRHALHSHSLGFRHPRTGRTEEVRAPLPADLAALVGRGPAVRSQPASSQRSNASNA